MNFLRRSTAAPPTPTAAVTPLAPPPAVAPKEAPQMHASELSIDNLGALDLAALKSIAANLQEAAQRAADEAGEASQRATAALAARDADGVVVALAAERAALERRASLLAQSNQAAAELVARVQPMLDAAGTDAAEAMADIRERQRRLLARFAEVVAAAERASEELCALPAELAGISRRHDERFGAICDLASPQGLHRPSVAWDLDHREAQAAALRAVGRLVQAARKIDPNLNRPQLAALVA